MNEHTRVQAQLSHYAGLDETTRQAVEQHVAHCPECAALLEQYRQQDTMVQEFMRGRAQRLLYAGTREHPHTLAQLLEQQDRPAWLVAWRYIYGPYLQRRQSLVATSTLVLVLFVAAFVIAVEGHEALRIVAQPTPAPTVMAPAHITAQQEIQQVLEREAELRNGKEALPFPVTLQLIDFVLEGELARVQVATSYEVPPESDAMVFDSIENRFYRQVDGRWVLTVPDETAWGELRTLETEYFSITYRALDEPVAHAAAEILDTAYLNMRQTLALPEARPPLNASSSAPEYPTYYREGKFHIVLEPETVNEWPPAASQLRQTSPFLRSVPVGVDRDDMLAYSIMAHVSLLTFSEALADVHGNPRINAAWNGFPIPIHQWLVEDSLPTPIWRTLAPRERQIQQVLEASFPLQLELLQDLASTHMSFVVSDLLMEYIVQMHGRSIVGPLVRGFAEYETWEELIGGVFALSVAEFEQGWNEYIAESYLSNK